MWATGPCGGAHLLLEGVLWAGCSGWLSPGMRVHGQITRGAAMKKVLV